MQGNIDSWRSTNPEYSVTLCSIQGVSRSGVFVTNYRLCIHSLAALISASIPHVRQMPKHCGWKCFPSTRVRGGSCALFSNVSTIPSVLLPHSLCTPTSPPCSTGHRLRAWRPVYKPDIQHSGRQKHRYYCTTCHCTSHTDLDDYLADVKFNAASQEASESGNGGSMLCERLA